MSLGGKHHAFGTKSKNLSGAETINVFVLLQYEALFGIRTYVVLQHPVGLRPVCGLVGVASEGWIWCNGDRMAGCCFCGVGQRVRKLRCSTQHTYHILCRHDVRVEIGRYRPPAVCFFMKARHTPFISQDASVLRSRFY